MHPSEEIYRRIWAIDQSESGAGARVGSVDPVSGQRPTDNLDVLLDEQTRSSGRRELDLATRPLFHTVVPDLLGRPTYRALRSLLDNYVVHYRAVEVISPEEEEETREFVALVAETEVMQLVHAHVAQHLRPGLSRERFREEVRRMWFETYTNHYNGRSTHHCSGFEHVFVGEGKYRPRYGTQETKGEVSGYHSWVKFFLDERAGRVDFLGHKYDLQGGQGADDPRVVTLQMVWNHQDFEGNLVAQLFKRKGGFFVGTSPEAEIAMGTLAFYESAAGLVNGDQIRLRLGDDDRIFSLVLYRNIEPDGTRGQYIRSFFPMYLGGDPQVGADTGTVVRPVVPALRNRGPIVVHQAMPNPSGAGDATGEWVELRNVGEEPIDVAGWELRDRMQRPWPVDPVVLAPGDTSRVEILRVPNALALGNRGGLIALHDSTGELRAAVRYGRAGEGEVVAFEPSP